MKGSKPQPIAERLWAKVDKSGGEDACWPWVGRRTPSGYGQLKIAGHQRGAHRIAYELTNGPIPDGMWVLHHCDNPPCCNPRHHFLGTPKDNTADMIAKGRFKAILPDTVGEMNSQAKLTDAIVREARERHARGGVTFTQLGKEYGVTATCIQMAITRVTWKHVDRIAAYHRIG